MYKKIVWPILIIITVALAIALIGGFMKSINITSSQKEDNIVKTDPLELIPEDNGNIRETVDEYDKITILVLGDSIGAGVGDDTGLGIGEGYAERIKEASNHETELVNLAVPGDVVADLIGVLDEDETIRIIKEADIILISIGGNDLNHLFGSDNNELYINYGETLKNFIDNLEKTLSLIYENNDFVKTAIIGLYNPYGDEISEDVKEMLLKWNYRTQLLVSAYPQSVYIPTYDLFKYNLDEYLALDGFHPSDAGYEAIVKRLFDVLNGG